MVPEGWSITKLSDLADVKRGAGSQYLTYVDEPDEGIRLIRIGDFLGDNPKFVSHTSDMDRFILKKDDILIAGTGATAGITFEVPEHFEGYAFSYNAPRIRPKKHVDKVFLVNFLKSNEITKQQRSLFTGNAQPFLDTKAIGGFKILTPPLPEQQKIADILSTWDAAIEKTEALLATAKAQKRALMQSLLTGKRRFPEFEGQPWKEVRIGDVAHEVSERNKDDTALTVISCTKTIGFVNSLDYFKKKVFSDDLSGYKIIRRNQIGYPSNHVEEGSIGIQNLHDAALVSPIYTIFETGPEADPMYLFRVLKTDRYRQIFAAATSASVDRRGSLRWKAFATIKVRLPSLHEQRRINETLSTADNEISELETSIAKLRTEKKALMQQLLTGKRRVTL